MDNVVGRDTDIKYYSFKAKQVEFYDVMSDSGHHDELFWLHIFTDKTSEKKLSSENYSREYQQMMLSSVAHEFRNPLSSISGNLELIQMISKEPKIEKFAKNAHSSWKMLNIYVEDILDLGRITKNAFQLNPFYFKVSNYSITK